MKKLLLFLLTTITVNAQNDWQILKQATLTESASEVFFINENKGWLGGSKGIIYFTDDGGASWTIQRDTSSAQKNLNDIFFLDENTGWACGYDGTVLFTTDGGTTWKQSTNTSTTEVLNGITFIDSQNGYACGTNGAIIKSTNGGLSWVVQISNTTSNLGEIAFWDVNKGFAIINSNVNGVLYTETGGILWNVTTLPIPSGTASSRMYGCDAVAGTSEGWIAGYHGLIFKTTDNAKNWSLSAHLYGSEFKIARDVDFADSQNGFACGNDGNIFKTSNGGATWDTLLCGTNQTITKLSTVSDQIIVAGGSYLQLRKTSDGGNTWFPIVDWPRVSFRAIGIADNLNITAGSFGGDITHSNNAGQSFSFPGNSTITSTGNLYCIYFQNTNLGFVAGQSAEILKSTDGGNTWSATNVTATDYKTVYAIYMINSTTGWAGAYSGIIYKTTNGGDDWSQIYDIGGDNIYGIHFFSDKFGYAVTNQGNIFQCTDGDTTWNLVASFPFEWYGLDFIDYQTGFAVGQDGIVVKTTDGGDNWSIDDTLGFVGGDPTQVPDLRDITFINNLEGWIVGQKGSIYHTTDGGINWQQIPSSTEETLYKVDFYSPGFGFAAGNNGTILSYGMASGIKSPSQNNLPHSVRLYSNYPNPFNPGTNIEYQLNISGLVELSIYDIRGQLVRTIVKENQQPGLYKYYWDGKNKYKAEVSSGTYCYQLKINDNVHAKRMILTK